MTDLPRLPDTAPGFFLVPLTGWPDSGRFLGVNTVRKLEPLTSEALVSWCDTVLTEGAKQPNNCRQTAAASLGQECHVVLGGKVLDAR